MNTANISGIQHQNTIHCYSSTVAELAALLKQDRIARLLASSYLCSPGQLYYSFVGGRVVEEVLCME